MAATKGGTTVLEDALARGWDPMVPTPAGVTARQAARLNYGDACAEILDEHVRGRGVLARAVRVGNLLERLKADAACVDCPWCFEVVEAGALQMLSCGHRVCAVCVADLADMVAATSVRSAGAASATATCSVCLKPTTLSGPISAAADADAAASEMVVDDLGGDSGSGDRSANDADPNPEGERLRRGRARAVQVADAVVALQDIAHALRQRKPALLAEIEQHMARGDGAGVSDWQALGLHAAATLDADVKAVTLQHDTLETRLGVIVSLLEQPASSVRDTVLEACVAEHLCLVPVAEDTLRFFAPGHVCRVPMGE
jgi:hypothetical protein